ncbi:MAG TPA: hypothetical protein VJT71_12540 [Pyrinomonadaceae bacterium]|nr:hypothetical protein [Pyrinomonadaceae bacterium]
MRDLKDTSIILELVLIGFQAIIWISLLILTVFGFSWVHLEGLKQWSTELSVGLVGVAYMMGVIFDKAVSALPYNFIVGGGPSPPSDDSPSPLALRVEILTKSPEVYEAMERRLNQHRLVRATVFNLALISLAALLFFFVQLGFNLRMFIAFLVLSVFFLGLALFTGKRSAQTLYFELLHAHKTMYPAADSDDSPATNSSRTP